MTDRGPIQLAAVASALLVTGAVLGYSHSRLTTIVLALLIVLLALGLVALAMAWKQSLTRAAAPQSFDDDPIRREQWREGVYDSTGQCIRRIIEASPMGFHIYRTDPQSSQLMLWMCNRAADNLFGIGHRALVGKPIGEAFPRCRDYDIPACCAQIARNGGQWLLPDIHYTDGVSSTVLDVCAFQIAPETVAVIFNDVTERIRGEEELRQAKMAAESANSAKDQFLAALSHELRTPLTPVLLSMQALLMEDDLPPHVREDVRDMHRNVELETRLIDDLLDVTRIASGKLQIQASVVDLHDVIRHAIEICLLDAHSKSIHLEVRLEAEQFYVEGDAPRLEQVFWNLIKNAVKFTPVSGRIMVRTRNESSSQSPGGSQIICEVIDSGIGMEAQTISRIFLPFEQGGRDSQNFGGLGMGLAISKAVVDLHGGCISAYSPGLHAGSTFTVSLQAVSAPPPNQPDHKRPIMASPTLTVLLVEDHEATARVLTRLLQRFNHRVLVAGDVASALALAHSNTFDLVISDLGLPDGSGLNLMPMLKAIRDVPGIAVSGYGMESDLRRSREAGFSEHLTKPITVQQLRNAIARATTQPASPSECQV